MKSIDRLDVEKEINDCLGIIESSIWEAIEDSSQKVILVNQIQRYCINAIATYFVSIPSTRKQFYKCALPYQPLHTFKKGHYCNTNQDHKFCRSHSLQRCPICGGGLTKI